MLTNICHDSWSRGKFVLCDLIKNTVVKILNVDLFILKNGMIAGDDKHTGGFTQFLRPDLRLCTV